MSNTLSLNVVKSPGRLIEPVTDFETINAAKLRYLKREGAYLLTAGPFSPSNANAKAAKSQGYNGYRCCFMNLSPADSSGVINLCSHCTPSCRDMCVTKSGKGVFDSTIVGRQRRTQWYAEEPETFVGWLIYELELFRHMCNLQGLKPAVRLNAGSDILWEHRCRDLFERFEDIQFYDYTKVGPRMYRELPDNYDLTFSRDETNEKESIQFLEMGRRVAVVFRVTPKIHKMPEDWQGYSVYNGDSHDLRFTEPGGVVVGLAAKGKARGLAAVKTGFVVDPTRVETDSVSEPSNMIGV